MFGDSQRLHLWSADPHKTLKGLILSPFYYWVLRPGAQAGPGGASIYLGRGSRGRPLGGVALVCVGAAMASLVPSESAWTQGFVRRSGLGYYELGKPRPRETTQCPSTSWDLSPTGRLSPMLGARRGPGRAGQGHQCPGKACQLGSVQARGVAVLTLASERSGSPGAVGYQGLHSP